MQVCACKHFIQKGLNSGSQRTGRRSVACRQRLLKCLYENAHSIAQSICMRLHTALPKCLQAPLLTLAARLLRII